MSNASNQNTEIELELTYLAKKLPAEIDGATPKRLLDIYVPESGVAHARLRLRQKGDKYEITKKLPLESNDASTHSEVTISLTEAEFTALSTASNKRVEKDRYNVVVAGHDAEIDVFKDELEGLVLIDFEFNSEADKSSFTAPAVCLADVTQEDFIAGALLAGKNYNDIQPELESFGYTRLEL